MEKQIMTLTKESRWRAELEIIEELGKVPSSREMQKLLLEKKGMKVAHGTVNSDLKKDLETLTETEYKNQKNGILSMLNDELDMVHGIAMDSGAEDKIRLDASKTASKLIKTKSDVLVKFRKAQVELNKEDKPIFNVFIGKAKQIDLKVYKKKQAELRKMVDKEDEDIAEDN